VIIEAFLLRYKPIYLLNYLLINSNNQKYSKDSISFISEQSKTLN